MLLLIIIFVTTLAQVIKKRKEIRMNIFYRTPNCWLNRFIAGVVGDMDTIYEYKEALSLYFSDPARVREESSLRGLLDYINPRVTTSTIAGGIWGLGLGE